MLVKHFCKYCKKELRGKSDILNDCHKTCHKELTTFSNESENRIKLLIEFCIKIEIIFSPSKSEISPLTVVCLDDDNMIILELVDLSKTKTYKLLRFLKRNESLLSIKAVRFNSSNVLYLSSYVNLLTNLEELTITGDGINFKNNFAFLADDNSEIFEHLQSLKVFIIEHIYAPKLSNNIKKLVNLKDLWLKSLILQSNTLPDAIGKLHRLERLFIYKSNIRRFPESIGQLRNLWYLHVDGVDSYPDSFSNLQRLRVLEIYCDYPTSLPSFSGLVNLEVLLIHIKNRYERIVDNNTMKFPKGVKTLQKLRSLQLKGKFTFDESFEDLSSLEMITISENITNLPKVADTATIEIR